MKFMRRRVRHFSWGMGAIGLLALYGKLAWGNSQVYFSPSGGCEEHVVELINSSQETLDVAIYSLNNEKILIALRNAKLRGVKIRILLDRVQATGNRLVSLGLKKDGFDVRIHSKNKIQHNKFAIADGKRVETGSFNWTKPAEDKNEENCVFFNEPGLVNQFHERFNSHLWVVNSSGSSIASFKRLEEKNRRISNVRTKN